MCLLVIMPRILFLSAMFPVGICLRKQLDASVLTCLGKLALNVQPFYLSHMFNSNLKSQKKKIKVGNKT